MIEKDHGAQRFAGKASNSDGLDARLIRLQVRPARSSVDARDHNDAPQWIPIDRKSIEASEKI